MSSSLGADNQGTTDHPQDKGVHPASGLLTCPWARHSAAVHTHTPAAGSQRPRWHLKWWYRILEGGARTFKTRAFYPWYTGDKREAKPEERPVMKWHTLPACHSTTAAAAASSFSPLSMWRIIPRAAARPARPVQLQLATASTWWRHFHVFDTPGDSDGDRPAQIKTNRSPISRLEDKITIAAFWGEAGCFLLESQGDSTSSILQFFYFVEKKNQFGNNCILHNVRDGRTDKANLKRFLVAFMIRSQSKCDRGGKKKKKEQKQKTKQWPWLTKPGRNFWPRRNQTIGTSSDIEQDIWLRVTATRTWSDLCSTLLLN